MATKTDPKDTEIDDVEDVKPPNGSQDWENRFREMAKRRRDAEKRVLELETEMEQHRTTAEGAGALSKRVKELELELSNKTSAWEQEGALRDAGLNDAESRDLATYLYNKMPEKDRPPIADVVKGWTEKPATAPKSMQGYLTDAGKGGGDAKGDAKAEGTGKAAAGAPGAGSGGGTAAKAPPRAGTGGAAPPAGGSPVAAGGDAAAIKAAKEKGAATGDWTDFKTLSGPAAAKLPGDQAAKSDAT